MAFTLDTSPIMAQKTVADYMAENEERQIKRQVAQAQIKKYGEFDIDKLGEQAFLKASKGMPLSQDEEAALKYIDAKQQNYTVNPVTGAVEMKPSLLDRAGMGGQQTTPNLSTPIPPPTSAPALPDAPVGNPWDEEFNKELASAAGNPRLQQSIRETYAKKKLDMNESESKAATYADRMANAETVLSDPDKMKEFGSAWERTKDWINPFGDHLNSPDYKSFNAAQKDFSTAKLRQESGAQINPTEFETDKQFLLPQPGDDEALLTQKAEARKTIAKGMQRAAGPAYKPVKPNLSTKISTKKPASGAWKIEVVE
jgi:hypothetical protein